MRKVLPEIRGRACLTLTLANLSRTGSLSEFRTGRLIVEDFLELSNWEKVSVKE